MIFYSFCRVVVRLFLKIGFRLEARGVHHVPRTGPVILCSNHISYLDPLVVAAPLNRKVWFMAKSELFRVPLFRQLIVKLGAFPVKRGGVSKETIKTVLTLLRQGELVCIFPQGTRSEVIDEGKKGAASFALKSGTPVVPVYISGYRRFARNRVIYGPPIDLTLLNDDAGGDRLEKATSRIIEGIKSLAEQA